MKRSLKEQDPGPIRLRAANVIQDAILAGEFSAGQEIPQLPLSQRLGLSQSSVREALLELEYRGFIRKSGRNWKLIELSEDELADLYQVRLLLEPEACRLAAAHWTAASREELEGTLRRMAKAASRKNYREHWAADIDFHAAIWRAQPNRSLEKQLVNVCMPIFAHGVLSTQAVSPESYRRSVAWHALIAKLLEARDGERAAQVARKVIPRFHRLNLADFWRR